MPRARLIILLQSDGTLPDMAVSHVTSRVVHRLGGLYSRTCVAAVNAEIEKARTLTEGRSAHFGELGRGDPEKERAYGRAQMAAYMDLNPVRAGMGADPADYRWSSYGKAVGSGRGAEGARILETAGG